MYQSHWKLTEKPFEDHLSPNYYYPSSTHQTALLKTRYAIENRREVVVICGPSGVGKSVIHQQLRSQLPEFIKSVITIPYPDLERDQLLACLAMQLGNNSEQAWNNPAASIRSIEIAFHQATSEEKQILLLIEEAEWLEARGGFEVLRLLLNLGKDTAANRSGLTIVMNGQPSLLAQLERHVSFNQRIAVRCLVHRFSEEETSAYVNHRLRAAGVSADKIFDSVAIDAIHFLTDGVPRRINTLCDMLLMVGYAQDMSRIPASIVEEVHRDLSPAHATS